MIDFEQARKEAYEQLQLTYTLFILGEKEKKELKLQTCKEIWRVHTEVFLPDHVIKPIEFIIEIPEDFPLIIPKIFLSQKDYDWIKYIPHVNTDPCVCIFDNETITVDPSQPVEILKSCILRAKKIIEDGLQKKNTESFTEEFIAYWTDSYDPKDKVLRCLSMILQDDEIMSNRVKFLYLQKPFLGYCIILYENHEEDRIFKSFLEKYDYKTEEHEAFYLGELVNLRLPFFYTNEYTYSLVSNDHPELIKDYEAFINRRTYPKVVLFSKRINNRRLLFGWQIAPLHTERKGYRPFSLSPLQVYNTFHKKEPVTRLHFEVFTPERLLQRTEGPFVEQRDFAISIAGLGSIGSNLLHYLISPELKHLCLIDPDILTIENINRHLLGLEYVHSYKATALKRFLELKNPLLKIDAYNSSIIKIIKSRPEVLNGSDFIFIAIGKDNIERYILDCLQNHIVTKPVFVFWVEPYLCGGHCLYLNPGHTIDYSDLYDNGLYKFNIIDSTEYTRCERQLLFREAGCQSSYMPYGQKNITLFLSSLVPLLFEIMESHSKKSMRLTWKGNFKVQRSLELTLSEVGQRLNFGELELKEL